MSLLGLDNCTFFEKISRRNFAPRPPRGAKINWLSSSFLPFLKLRFYPETFNPQGISISRIVSLGHAENFLIGAVPLSENNFLDLFPPIGDFEESFLFAKPIASHRKFAHCYWLDDQRFGPNFAIPGCCQFVFRASILNHQSENGSLLFSLSPFLSLHTV